MKGILSYAEMPLVSQDFINNTNSYSRCWAQQLNNNF